MPIKPEKTPKLPENWPVRGKLVGVAAAAELIGIDKRTVSNLCALKKMKVPHYKVCGRFKFDVADIEDYLRKARVEGKK